MYCKIRINFNFGESIFVTNLKAFNTQDQTDVFCKVFCSFCRLKFVRILSLFTIIIWNESHMTCRIFAMMSDFN